MNESLAKSVLRYWYDAASKYPTNFNIPFDAFVQQLQDSSNGTFLSNFGSAANAAENNIGIEGVTKAMRDLAIATQGLVPTYPDGAPRTLYWFNALSGAADPSLTNPAFLKKIVPEVAASSAKGLSNFAFAGLSIYLVGTLIVGGVALYFALKPAGKALS